MVQFWRFAQLKTLFWACFEQNSPFERFQVKGQILEELMRSPTMCSAYVQLPAIQKVCFISWAFDMGNEFENLRQVTEILSEKPYSSAYICQAARMEIF